VTQAHTAGGTGSHTLPNHVIVKWTVNTTLVKGHHAQTRRTPRNFLFFHTIAVRPINKLYIIIFDWEDKYGQLCFLAI
jgi:hypothetical protein